MRIAQLNAKTKNAPFLGATWRRANLTLLIAHKYYGRRPAQTEQKSLILKKPKWVIHKLRAVLHRIRHEVQHLVFPHRMLLSSNGIFDVASP